MRRAWALAAMLASGPAAAAGGPPVIPVEEATAAPAATAPTAAPAGPVTVTVTPGVNAILPVAVGHLNRIVTPFEAPRVRTTAAQASTQVSGRVVYVAPADERPVTLFITDGADEDRALSLTLAPRRIPPQEIRLRLGGDAGAPEAAEAWERADPYVRTLVKLLRAVALQEVPPGYALAPQAPADPPACLQPGLRFTFRQELTGHAFRVLVARAENVAGRAVEFLEQACLGEERVAAVAAWPRVVLRPGEATEVYVVLRRARAKGGAVARRPSVLGARTTAYGPSPGTGPWGVQVLALSSERMAREQAAALRALGYPAEVYQGRGELHYVRLSGYGSRAEADRVRERLARFGFDALVVVRTGGAAPQPAAGEGRP